ncbi:MAG: hypothetical protein JO301_04500 [Chitinophagaceae bacterium]|nr:hypothetical protein [Chitinophagaceae bacterium]
MRCLLSSLLILFSLAANAQCKTFRIGSRGDTLDCVDKNGMKQGKWVVKVAPLRGEPGFEEEGVFVNDRKEGTWRRFNLMGDPLAVENYKWGNKNGISRYFTITGIEHEESWRASNPEKAFDTVEVQDLKDPNRYELVVVKNDGRSLRHGIWKYYNPNTGAQIASEKYVLDKLQEPDAENVAKTMTKVTVDTTKGKSAALPEKSKPKEVLEFEKKTSGKKKAVRDGRTGG